MEELLYSNLAVPRRLHVEGTFRDEFLSSMDEGNGQRKEVNDRIDKVNDALKCREDLIGIIRRLSKVASEVYTSTSVKGWTICGRLGLAAGIIPYFLAHLGEKFISKKGGISGIGAALVPMGVLTGGAAWLAGTAGFITVGVGCRLRRNINVNRKTNEALTDLKTAYECDIEARERMKAKLEQMQLRFGLEDLRKLAFTVHVHQLGSDESYQLGNYFGLMDFAANALTTLTKVPPETGEAALKYLNEFLQADDQVNRHTLIARTRSFAKVMRKRPKLGQELDNIADWLAALLQPQIRQ